MSSSSYISQEVMRKIIAQIGAHRGVEGTVLVDADGLPLQSSSNMGPELAEKIAAQVASFIGKVYVVADEIAKETPKAVRIEMSESDVEIIPDRDTGITICALVTKGAFDGK